jgi:DNA-binding transcriptional LysR family regulator
MPKALDLDTVRAFVLTAELGSFTRASEVLGIAQAAISLKLKRLEVRLGYRLLERTPRFVRLSARGSAFIDLARELLAAHERAVDGSSSHPARRLVIGISDHVAGPELPKLLATLNAYDPQRIIEVRIAASRDLTDAFELGTLDAAIVRRDVDKGAGKFLMDDPMGWFAAPTYRHRAGEPLRLATMASPCGIRAVATKALDTAGLSWTEVFVGGGVMAVGAAVIAGVAVAALAKRVAPLGGVEVGTKFGLPPLPSSQIILRSRARDKEAQQALRTLAACFRATPHR